MVLQDPVTGSKICLIEEKFLPGSLNDSRIFQMFTYKPKDKGQESTERDEGTPVYRYAVVHENTWNIGNEWGKQYNSYLYENNQLQELPIFSAFRETWHWEWDSKVNVFKGDQVLEANGNLEECDVVAKFGTLGSNWRDRATDDTNRYAIEMAKGMDPILNLCLAIICNAMMDEEI